MVLGVACGGQSHAIDGRDDGGEPPGEMGGSGAGSRDSGVGAAGAQAGVDAGVGAGGAPGAGPGATLPDLATPPSDGLDPDEQLSTWGVIADPPHPIFDPAVIRHYEVEVDPDDWARINETAYLEEYIEGRLHFEGAVVEPVGLRFKGFRGSLYSCFDFDASGRAVARTCARLNLKLSFNEYDREGRFYDLKKLNFHAMENDRSKLRERLSYWLFRQFGVPAPRSVHATLSVNGVDQGLFALVEQVDGRFSRHRFADGGEGNVYKERWPTSSTDADYFLSGLKTNEDDADVSVDKMVAFAEALADADDETIEAVLEAHTDLDALMRYLAVDRAIEHFDGITAFRCQPESAVPALPPEVREAQTPPLGWEVCQNKNFYWYEETDAPRAWLVAWDMDYTFSPFGDALFPAWDQEPTSCPVLQMGRPPSCDPLIRFFATTLRPRYVEAGNAFLEQLFQQSIIDARLREWSAQIAPYLGQDPNLAADTLADDVARRIQAFTAEMAR
jgi:hypothetical protein